MTLQSTFKKAVAGLEKFFDEIEIAQLNGRIETARSGFMITPTASRFSHTMPLSPETAESMITICQKRIAELREKHSPAP